MTWSTLYVFVEGPDDEDFCRSVFQSKLEAFYDHIEVIKYQRKSHEKRCRFIRSIKAMPNCEYVYLCDYDGIEKTRKNAQLCFWNPCIEAKKKSTRNDIPEVAPECVFVVVDCIESWYLAGISTRMRRSLKMKGFANTQIVCKSRFREMVPKNMSVHEFMTKILSDYSISLAKRRNESFRHFTEEKGIA